MRMEILKLMLINVDRPCSRGRLFKIVDTQKSLAIEIEHWTNIKIWCASRHAWGNFEEKKEQCVRYVGLNLTIANH